jgi:hypothetical protein
VTGDFYSYFRDDSLNAANPLLGRTLPMDSAAVGRQRRRSDCARPTFYFANVEQRNLISLAS